MNLIPIRDCVNGCSSYIIGDEISGRAMVIDPLRSIGHKNYVISAAKERLYIEMVVDTHVHADHYSAARELAEEIGIQVSMSENAPNDFQFNKLRDEQVISLGNLEIVVMHALGHTPDNLALKIIDRSRSSEVVSVFTGDSLFVGNVGRPDLVYESEEMIKNAINDQYSTIFKKLLTLPDYVEIFPAHSGSSSCGGLFLSPKFNSTIGYERRFNQFLRVKSLEEFSDMVIKTLKPPPVNAKSIREWNLGRSIELYRGNSQ